MKAHRKQKLILIFLGIAGFGSALGLTLYALSENINLFFSPTDIVNGKAPMNANIKVGGLVVEGSVKRDPESLKVSFKLETEGDQVEVFFDGILPDLFREGQGIIAMGQLSSPTRVDASEVLAKHDENYMPPEVAQAMEKIKHERAQKQSTSEEG